jgi:hypothetical protein
MAGAGYKLYATGDVLTAAQVNTYLQEQTVMVFANAAARTSALSGVLAEGMLSYLKDTDAVEKYTGSAWTSIAGASTSGLTLITRNAFTAQSSVTIDNIFSSSYFTYLVNYKIWGSASTSVTLQGVYSGTVQTSAVHNYAYYGLDRSANIRSGNGSDVTSAIIGLYQASENDACLGSLTWSNVGNSSQKPLWIGSVNSSVCWSTVIGGLITTAQTYTGVKLAGTTGTISGYVEVYGLAKA